MPVIPTSTFTPSGLLLDMPAAFVTWPATARPYPPVISRPWQHAMMSTATTAMFL